MKRIFYLLLIFGLLIFPFISGFVNSTSEGTSIFGISADSGVKLTEKWDYLGKEWKIILMGNPFITAIDLFFKAISFIFAVLLGIPYSLSIAFFLTMGLWLYFFFLFNRILSNSLFSKWVALGISFGSSILLAQVGLFQWASSQIIGLFFGEKAWWMKLIIGTVVITALVTAFLFGIIFSKQIAMSKKKNKDEINRIKLEAGAKTGEALSKSVSGK